MKGPLRYIGRCCREWILAVGGRGTCGLCGQTPEFVRMDEQPEPQRAFIIGGTRREAVGWCRENGVAPYARTTYLLTTPDSVRGLTIRPEDRVVWHATRPIDERLVESVRIAAAAGGTRV